MRPFWYRVRAYKTQSGLRRLRIRPGILGKDETDVALGAAGGWFNNQTLQGILKASPEWVLAGGE